MKVKRKVFIKFQNAKKEKDKDYFYESIRIMLSHDETIDNFETVLAEYYNALSIKEETVKKLYDEIKIIKKLKV